MSVTLSYWFRVEYERWPNNGYKIIPQKDIKLSDEDTYYLIVGPTQQQYIPLIEGDARFKILYKSPRAVNQNYPSYGPRNTLYILETADKVDEPAAS